MRARDRGRCTHRHGVHIVERVQSLWPRMRQRPGMDGLAGAPECCIWMAGRDFVTHFRSASTIASMLAKP